MQWHPSRPGFFYFSFNNGSVRTCQGSQKLSIKVSPAALLPPPENATTPSPAELSPTAAAAPAPTSGGGSVVSSSPAYPWPFRPHPRAVSPTPSASASSPVTVPDNKGGGIPFINSNPAVPLPTGEVDSATIRPLPTSGSHHGGQVLFFLSLHACFLICFSN